MNFYPNLLALPLLQICFLFAEFAAAGGNPSPLLAGNISINCGGLSSSVNGSLWIGDAMPEFFHSVRLKGFSRSSRALHKKSISADYILLYNTARISRSKFSYEFQLSSGQKILRLHFNPASYKGFKGLQDLFTVEAGPFTLLSNFSASLTARALGMNSFSKEFCLSVKENQSLSVTFSPASFSPLLDAYAFINGIEILSASSRLSYFSAGEENGLQVVGGRALVNIDDTTALEVICRQSIKHAHVDGPYDMFELGSVDPKSEGTMITNLTWRVPVDVGFRYLIRLRFSRLGLKMVETGGVIFKVLINEMIAHANTEMIRETDGIGNIPGKRDYVLMMKGNKQDGKRELLISLHSNEEFINGHGPLRGFEIFKLSNPDNSLATPNPLRAVPDAYRLIHNVLAVLGYRNMVAAVVITTLVVGNICVHLFQQHLEASTTEEENVPSARAKGRCRRFSLAEIRFATRNFSDGLVIGRGGFGKVYKGIIDNGQGTVAIKRLKPNSQQGAHEFLTEIETLSELRHVNLVSLVGYCNEHREMILVYDYMACGTLADHLYKLARASDELPSLTWKQRLNICIGASRGLDYLHTGHSLIHRDVKTSNILLDGNFVAKVSDFGLARHEDRSELQSHVSTKVKGTYGYLDPYYFSTRKLTRKSDTYAFGVILLETLCERSALDLSLPEDEQILTKWAQKHIREGKLDEIVASSIRGEISESSLREFVAVAERCLQDEPKKRPTMAQVVLQLESVLEQQDDAGLLVSNEIANDVDNIRQWKVETKLPANTEQQEMATLDQQTVATHLREQTNIKMVNAKPAERKPRINRPSKLWPLEAFWSRVKPSKQNDFPISDIHLTKFNWGTIVATTNRFSPHSQCEKSSVYKGVLPTGQIVAVKRISAYYDDENLIDEILLLQKLGHRNIVRLIGYCIHKEERVVVYEFIENGSLDTFMMEKHRQLEWPTRFHIIIGIARALLYLHQESGLGIIHGHLTLENILLDSEMHPKIVGIKFGQKNNTTYVDRNICVMCPDYARYGRFSFKSDVYSFGIIALEILTGARSHQFTPINTAWKLWEDGKAVELVDRSLGGAFPVEEALRCIQVCLLCTQQQPEERPDMQSVLTMLEGAEAEMATPRPWPPIASAVHNSAAWLFLTKGDSIATFEYDDTMQR